MVLGHIVGVASWLRQFDGALRGDLILQSRTAGGTRPIGHGGRGDGELSRRPDGRQTAATSPETAKSVQSGRVLELILYSFHG
ncbi:MAG: hypothetical protein CMJ58_15715 [Planctomycetaceae bacterium]|nr:hypothetical protein [Planctomycetaceae bacterium]